MDYFRMKSPCGERAPMRYDWDPHRKWKFSHRDTWVQWESWSRQKMLCSQWGPERTSGWELCCRRAGSLENTAEWSRLHGSWSKCEGATCLRDWWCSEHPWGNKRRGSRNNPTKERAGDRGWSGDTIQQRRGQETEGPENDQETQRRDFVRPQWLL